MYLGPDAIKRAGQISEAHLTEMGRVIVNWSVLENQVNVALVCMLNIPIGPGLAVVTPVRNFRQRLTMLLHAFKESGLDNRAGRKQLIDICKSIEALYSFRNQVAHGIWGTDLNSEDEIAKSVRFNLKEKIENEWSVQHLTVKQMRGGTKAMLLATKTLGKFMSQYRPAQPPKL